VELTAEVVQKLVERLFGPADREAASALLERYGADGEPEVIRVRVAALKLSDGSLDALERAVGDAKQDHRDVLVEAEYPSELRHRMWWRPSSATKQRLQAADRAQYDEWLSAQLEE
jgi:hypothetical protein